MKFEARSTDIESPIGALLLTWVGRDIKAFRSHHTYKRRLTFYAFRLTFIKVSYLNVSQVLVDRRKGEQRPPYESGKIRPDDLCRPRD
jgi:hypothetical protein